MTYHAMFSLYIMTGLLALVISVSLFCKSVAEAKEWKRSLEKETGITFIEFSLRWSQSLHPVTPFSFSLNAITGFDSLICEGTKMTYADD